MRTTTRLTTTRGKIMTELKKVKKDLMFIIEREDKRIEPLVAAGKFPVEASIRTVAREALTTLNEFIESDKGEISDGYHTFNELYEHRHVLFANVVNQSNKSWKSKLHDDGTMFEGWFIAGMQTDQGDLTYHLPIKHWKIFKCKELEKAPKWDGHTSDDVVNRLTQAAINTIKGEES
jgi:hypothetical protein